MKNRYLTKELSRMLWNALIQRHFNSACPAQYPILNEKRKKKIQIMQNKSIRFCLKLYKMHHIFEEGFRLINLLPTSKRFDRYINTITYNFDNNACPNYLSEIYECAPHCRIGTRNSFPKLKKHLNEKHGTKTISCISHSIWNSFPHSVKKANSLNTSKQNLT